MRPYNPFSMSAVAYKEWRRHISLAHEGGPNVDIFCRIASINQMWYVIWNALESAKEKSQ